MIPSVTRRHCVFSMRSVVLIPLNNMVSSSRLRKLTNFHIFAGACFTTGPVMVGSTTGIPTAEQTSSMVFIMPSMCAICTSLYACNATVQASSHSHNPLETGKALRIQKGWTACIMIQANPNRMMAHRKVRCPAMVADWQVRVESEVLLRGVRVLINNRNLTEGKKRLSSPAHVAASGHAVSKMM